MSDNARPAKTSEEREAAESGPGESHRSDDGSGEAPEPPIFRHPQWLLGVVLVFGVVAILAGLRNPVWFLIGFPAILTLIVWIWVRWRVGLS